jgi:CRP/FNR family cyclic AMP-dependent transcriptional regulator
MADELDFSSPAPAAKPPAAVAAAQSAVQGTAQSTVYSPALALEFFRATGTVEQKPAGKPIFSENEKPGGLFAKGARMYLLLDGEIGLMIKGKFFGVVKAGEIFGELAVIAGVPRSATAMAKADCKVLSLDEKQFHVALQKTPEFALMLMSSMGQRLRQSIAKLAASPAAAASAPVDRSGVIDKKMLAELARELSGQPPVPYGLGKTIVAAGAVGTQMYVVMDGHVAISIGNRVVERVGAGGLFGEMALVDRSARAATAVAESDCALIAIGRNDFISLVKAKPVFGALLLKALAQRMQYLAQQVALLPG